jgi:hypothetical protein
MCNHYRREQSARLIVGERMGLTRTPSRSRLRDLFRKR